MTQDYGVDKARYATLISGAFRRHFEDPNNIDTTASLAASEETGTAFAQLTVEDTIEVLSAQAGDTQIVTLFGIDNDGVRAQETVTLNGTTAVESVKTWRYIEEVRLNAEAAGNVTVRRTTGNIFITGIVAGQLTDGNAQLFTNEFAGFIRRITVFSSTASDIITAELRWYPDEDDCLDSGDGFVILDTIIANALLSSSREYSEPLRIPPGGWLAVFVKANNNDSGGGVTIHGWLERDVTGSAQHT